MAYLTPITQRFCHSMSGSITHRNSEKNRLGPPRQALVDLRTSCCSASILICLSASLDPGHRIPEVTCFPRPGTGSVCACRTVFPAIQQPRRRLHVRSTTPGSGPQKRDRNPENGSLSPYRTAGLFTKNEEGSKALTPKFCCVRAVLQHFPTLCLAQTLSSESEYTLHPRQLSGLISANQSLARSPSLLTD